MKNEIVLAECIDMSVDGHGIARAGQLVVFVKGMIKGEIADVRIVADKKNYSYGIIEKMIRQSPHRIESICPISYKCGGCDYRYIDYDYQLVLKKEVLVNTFKGYEVADIIPDDDPYYYRNKVQIPIKDSKMGFYRKYSNDITEFSECYIESETANRIIDDLKKILKDDDKKLIRHILIRHGKVSNEVMVGFIVRTFAIDLSYAADFLIDTYPEICSIILNLNDKETNVILGSEEKLLYGRDYIYDEYDGIKVRISLKSFYQVNHDQMLKLYAKVKELAAPEKSDEVLDLYCGIGTIALYMARFVKHVTGVEIVEAAIDNARENAVLNKLDNTDFILADASKGMDEYLKNKDIVILDPPRKGISTQLIESLIASNVKKIIYVSCNPATLYRDLELLKGTYKISRINPVDMFPFTVHVENVCCLYRQ